MPSYVTERVWPSTWIKNNASLSLIGFDFQQVQKTIDATITHFCFINFDWKLKVCHCPSFQSLPVIHNCPSLNPICRILSMFWFCPAVQFCQYVWFRPFVWFYQSVGYQHIMNNFTFITSSICFIKIWTYMFCSSSPLICWIFSRYAT